MVIIESIGVAAIGWVASPLVGKLLNEGFKSLGINADKKLQDLRVTVLPVLKSVIEKAEGSAHRSEVEDWLQRLKDAYDDADDALDLLNYWRLEREAANRVRLFRVPKPPKLIMPILKGGRDMISLRKIKLKRKLNKLEKIACEALKLRDLLGAQPDQTAAVTDIRQAISVPPLKVFGRDKDRDEIIRRLKMDPTAIRDPGSSSMPTIAIREPESSSMPTIAIREPGSSSIPTIAIHEPGSSSMPTITINDPGSSSMPTIAIHKPGSLVIPIIAIHEPGSLVIPIIAIVGRPGVGKTTLAQYIYQQLKSEGRDGHFHLIMWVHASHNFNMSKIMKKIIQAACTTSGPQDPINLNVRLGRIETHLCNLNTMAVGSLDSPEYLQQKMSTMLTTKKFLLVIDNVWCDGDVHKNNWDTLFRCLSNCCSPGCKILVTSQTDDAPRKIVATKSATLEYIHDMEELEENDFLDLFIHHALPDGEIDSSLRKDLEEKCKKIAKKLNKDPTAAKIIGETIALKLADLLRSKGDCRTYLRTIAEKDWSGNKTQALMWSYRQLPAHLQRCFSYCSLYPRGYMFDELELVRLWMAQDFIKPDHQNGRMEDVGKDYLEMLVYRFYIQSCDRDYHFSRQYPHVSSYTLHELLYDLAEKVTRNYCVRIKGNHQKKIPSTIRHLSIPANKLNDDKEEICKLKKLRTLIVTKGESRTSEENVATDIFKRLKKLHVLVLEVNIENLAEFIGEMKHLRILKVPKTSKLVLPESVRTLYQLQVLDGYFCVSKEKGNELEQLQNLNELRGILHIENLENVKSKESAIAANLKEKKYLDELYLVWSDSEDNVNSDLDVEILEGLQLPPNLTRLDLNGYRGQLCPSWPESQTSNIEKLELFQCQMLEELPRMDQLYPSCRSLVLWSLSKLKALHTLPPRLERIEIIGTPFLTFATKEDLQMSPAEKRSIIEVMRKSTPEWFLQQDRDRESLVDDERKMMNFIAAMNDSNKKNDEFHNKSVPADDMDITAVWERWLPMHERKMGLIYNIQNEAKLLLPSTLTKLKIWTCNITDHALSACLQTLTSLTDLSLGDIKTVTCLPSEDVLGKLKALKTLHIWKCWAITSLGGIKFLPCLTNLDLDGFPCLDGKTAFLPSSLEIITFASCADVDVILANADLQYLSHLMIRRCHMLEKASLQFGKLPSLRSLIIEDCPGLSSSVDLQELRSLELLALWNCSNLQEVMNFPGSLKHLRIRKCPILERSMTIDTCSRVLMLSGIPVEDTFGRPLIREEEEREPYAINPKIYRQTS